MVWGVVPQEVPAWADAALSPFAAVSDTAFDSGSHHVLGGDLGKLFCPPEKALTPAKWIL